ncbi:MAG: hypothetical protein JW703_01680 [Candidatus Diapherotrites archaeon]|nr:hypothetical protein [Candidatus Diapherotrites archaeon]
MVFKGGIRSFKSLMNEKSVRRFSFIEKAKQIGQGRFGEVFLAKLFFSKGAGKKVAVKFFKSGFFLNDSLAKEYNKIIFELMRAGVKIPKMRAVKLKLRSKMTKEDFQKRVIPIDDSLVPFGYNSRLSNGEWVLVSQFFGSSAGKKLSDKSRLQLPTEESKFEALTELVKVANLGYYPPDDLVESIKTRNGFGAIPFDIDVLVRNGKKNPPELSEKMIDNLILISSDNFEFKKLLSFVLTRVSPVLKKHLEKKLFLSDDYLNSKRSKMYSQLIALRKEDKLIDMEYD